MNETVVPLRIEYSFQAPVANVFSAWSEADKLKEWAWGSLSNNVQAEVDFRVGGSYRITTARAGDESWTFLGRFLEIVPDKKIVYTIEWTAPMGYAPVDEKATVEFHECVDKTEITFTHDGVPGQEAREEHRQGWINTFEALASLLGRGS